MRVEGPLPTVGLSTGRSEQDRWLERQVTLIWALLFFNGLPFLSATVLPLPQRVAQLLTAGALLLAFLLAIRLNPRLLVGASVVLGVATLLALLALTTGVRGTAGAGGLLRCGRLLIYLSTLWLLTPWWGRPDLLFARCHLRVLVGVGATVVAGILVAPSVALGGRLGGVLWPIPPPQVGEFAALAVGLATVLWMARAIGRGPARLIAGAGLALILLSRTRTALIGLVLGLVVAAASLFLSNRRVRRAVLALVLALPFIGAALAPSFADWFTRDQSAEQLRGLTGRTKVWTALLQEPRTEFEQWFGHGLSDKSFDGRPVDSTWLAAYQDQGVVGVVLVALTLVFLLVAAGFSRDGPSRAIALFIVVYCCCASYTEVGLGDATPYLLHIVVAASVLVARSGADPPRRTAPLVPSV